MTEPIEKVVEPAAPSLGQRSIRRLRRLAAGLVGLFVVVGIYGHLLDRENVLIARDVPTLHLPLRHDFAQLLAAGEGLPAWNPWINSGQPILSNPHYAAWYPPTWLLAVLPVHLALQVEIVLHGLFAFAGAFLFARHLGCRPTTAILAAVAFATGGPFVALAGMPLMLFGFAWMPWVLLWGDRALRAGLPGSDRASAARAVCCAGLAWGLQILSGDPAAVMSTALALVLLAWSATGSVHRRAPWLRLAGIGILAVLLGAVQVVPTWLRLHDSARGGAGLGVEQAAVWSARPERLLELVAPHAFGDPTRDEEDLYFGWTLHDRGYPFLLSISPGVLPLVLALSCLAGFGTPRRALWVGAVGLGLFFGLGQHNPLYATLHERLPFLSMVRYPEKFLLLPLLCLPFAAALGWERAIDRWQSRRRYRVPLLVAAAAALLALGALTVMTRPGFAEAFVQTASGLPPGAAQTVRGANYLRHEAWLAGWNALAVLAFLVFVRLRPTTRWVAAAAVALVGLEIATYGQRFLPVMPAATFFTAPPIVRGLAPGDRIATDDGFRSGPAIGARVGTPGTYQVRGRLGALAPYTANLWGFGHALNEDLDLMLTSWGRLPLGLLHRAWPARERAPAVANLFAAWNVHALVRARTPEEMLPELRAGKTPAPAAIQLQPKLPRFRAPAEVVFHSDLQSAVGAAERDGFAAVEREHVLGGRAGDGQTERFDVAPKIAARELGGTLELDIEAAAPSVIVAAVTFDEGWSAESGGPPVPLWPTAIGQIAFRVPEGTHTVRLRYRDPAVALGGALTLITLLVGLLIVRRAAR